MPEQHTLATETASLCPICLQRIPAHRQVVDKRVDLLKFCPEHGEFRTLIWQGPPLLSDWSRPKIPSQPPVCLTESEGGCPYDCGLCPNHGQHSCSVLLEITSRCNLSCPVCFAASSSQAPSDPTLDDIDRWYQTAKKASGTGIVIQLSGGEPTVRDDLPAIIEMGRRHGFDFIQLNSNGLRLAQEPGYAKRLKEAGLSNVFLQFDGTEDSILRTLRGRDMLKEKILAIDHCVDNGLGVVLVPTVVPGVNNDNLGSILDFALDWAPGVRGVHFQPISYFGRFPKAPADADRITLPQIMRTIEEQTEGRMRREHFAPPGCEHSHCSFHGNFLVEENGSLRALTKAGECGCNKPKPASEGAEKSKEFLTQQWAAPAQPESGSAAANEFDAFIERVRSHTFAVSAMAFQDAWNIDLERARSCCIHVMSKEETLVPFCLYNLTAASGKPSTEEASMQVSPLHIWIAAELDQTANTELDLESLRALQLERLNNTLAHASTNSPFYKKQLQNGNACTLASLEDLTDLPFTSADDLRQEGLQMLGVSQSAIERVVTLESSGTTGAAKRLYFTGEELARTQAFFRLGMCPYLDPGDRVLILLPGDLPASAGDLLATALRPLGVECQIEGIVTDPGRCAALLAGENFSCVVGIPVQVLSVLRHPNASRIARGRIKSVFLTSDYVPSALVDDIRRQWGCPALNHYGMTELALTGGVECQALDGYHLREPDLYFEVVDPVDGRPLTAGETGEVVVTTLTRKGLPLIRYRTGDLARFVDKPCACGSNLPRLSKLQGRIAQHLNIGADQQLSMPLLDETLFLIPDLINYQAVLSLEQGVNCLSVTVETTAGSGPTTLQEVNRRLQELEPIRTAVATGTLRLAAARLCPKPLPVSATIKRSIVDQRKDH